MCGRKCPTLCKCERPDKSDRGVDLTKEVCEIRFKFSRKSIDKHYRVHARKSI